MLYSAGGAATGNEQARKNLARAVGPIPEALYGLLSGEEPTGAKVEGGLLGALQSIATPYDIQEFQEAFLMSDEERQQALRRRQTQPTRTQAQLKFGFGPFVPSTMSTAAIKERLRDTPSSVKTRNEKIARYKRVTGEIKLPDNVRSAMDLRDTISTRITELQKEVREDQNIKDLTDRQVLASHARALAEAYAEKNPDFAAKLETMNFGAATDEALKTFIKAFEKELGLTQLERLERIVNKAEREKKTRKLEQKAVARG